MIVYPSKIFFCSFFAAFLYKLMNKALVIWKQVSKWQVKHVLKIYMKKFLKH